MFGENISAGLTEDVVILSTTSAETTLVVGSATAADEADDIAVGCGPSEEPASAFPSPPAAVSSVPGFSKISPALGPSVTVYSYVVVVVVTVDVVLEGDDVDDPPPTCMIVVPLSQIAIPIKSANAQTKTMFFAMIGFARQGI